MSGAALVLPPGTPAPADEAGERFTFFYGGEFSQWYPSPFAVDGILYNCAEQYMMAQKARVFGDHRALALILTTDDPSEQKALGKQVVGYSDAVWHSVARDVVLRASLAKFTSTPHLRSTLLGTEGTTLVEASPTDRVWGIGRGMHDPLRLERRSWNGRNWLGQVLTDAREQLLQAWRDAR